ncbi:hypothetical protein ACIF70_18325 [Actinacidiphila glaucinigra]
MTIGREVLNSGRLAVVIAGLNTTTAELRRAERDYGQARAAVEPT